MLSFVCYHSLSPFVWTRSRPSWTRTRLAVALRGRWNQGEATRLRSGRHRTP